MTLLKYKGFVSVALVAAALAYLTSNIAGYIFAEPPRITNARAGEQAGQNVNAQMVTGITERNLFDIDKTLAPAELAVQNSQGSSAVTANVGEASYETTFGGKLTGVTVATNDNDSRAIVLMNNNDVYVLRMNRTLDNMTLTELTYESAVVDKNGNKYKLTLEESTGSAAPKPVATNTAARPTTTPAAKPAESGGTENVSLERGELMDQLKDINTVLRSLLVSPLYVDSEFAGYRIARMQDNSPMRTLGFRPGDIINRINGEELTNPELLFSMLQKIDEISAVSIDITRGGEKKTLFVEIQ